MKKPGHIYICDFSDEKMLIGALNAVACMWLTTAFSLENLVRMRLVKTETTLVL